MASSVPASDDIKYNEPGSAELLATLGVSREQFTRHQEQLRRSLLPPDSRVFPIPHQTYSASSLPFPLNLPPSYPVHSSSSSFSPSTRALRQPQRQQSTSVTPSHVSKKTSGATGQVTRALTPSSVPLPKGKGKGTLDAFMDSRQSTRVQEPESSSSDSDMPVRKLQMPADDYAHSDSSALPSSSPPSSSPLRTPKESTPLFPVYTHSFSPTPKPNRQPEHASNLAFTLPPGPYSFDKPAWSLAALIGQAINASHSGALTLNDIYTYISTVYPYYDRGEKGWMSSMRHSLSVNDSFERVPDDTGKKTKGKAGTWRIRPGDEACFAGGNFIRKGARAAGPGQNQGGRKRPRENDEERSDKKPKAEVPGWNRSSRSMRPRSQTTHSRSSSPSLARTIYSHPAARRLSSPPSLTTSQSTAPSDGSLPDPFDLPPSSPIPVEYAAHDAVTGSPDSPELPLALITGRRDITGKGRSLSFSSSLEPGFELSGASGLQNSPHFSTLEAGKGDVNRDLFTRVLSSTSFAHASTSQVAGPSSSPRPARLLFPPLASASMSSIPVRPSTPPRRAGPGSTLSPVRTPISHRGLHMSPSRSLAHYKSSVDPERKAARFSGDGGRHTPPPRDVGEETAMSTPKRLVFPSAPPQRSPFRTPARSSMKQLEPGYDPYDPNTVLADELASIRNAREPQESPGGFFGKEGRKLMYDSPGVPSRSHWRFKDEF